MKVAAENFSAEEMPAAVINTAVKDAEGKGGVSYAGLARDVEDTAAEVGVESADVRAYVDALRSFSHDAAIGPLPEGVGGLFDGSITVATATVEVGENGCSQTIAMMNEVFAHELYHATNHHTDAMQTFGDGTVIIAGAEFTTTDAIEALTVRETGDKFVSGDYENNSSEFFAKIESADLTIDDVRYAINETHDLTGIDDRMFEPITIGSGQETPAVSVHHV